MGVGLPNSRRATPKAETETSRSQRRRDRMSPKSVLRRLRLVNQSRRHSRYLDIADIYRFAKTISLPPLLEPRLVVEIDGFAFSPVGHHDVDLREVSALLRNLQSQCPAGMPQRIGYDLELDFVEQILPGDRLTVLVDELHLSANLPERAHPAADDVLCRVDEQKYA